MAKPPTLKKPFLHDIEADAPDAPGDRGEFTEDAGFSLIQLPPDLFGPDELRFTVAIVRSVQRMEPASTPMHRAVYRTLRRLADMRVRASPRALVLGLLLAASKLHHIEIKTHLRDLAKEAGVRYANLLKIRGLRWRNWLLSSRSEKREPILKVDGRIPFAAPCRVMHGINMGNSK